MPSDVYYTNCPVCNSPAISKALVAKDHTVSGENFEIWECRNCSLMFTQKIPLQELIGKYYRSEEYISHSNTRKGGVNRLYHFVRNFTLKIKKNLIESESTLKSGNLLDIGAGTGAFIHYMSDAGWTVFGLEEDPEAINRAKTLYNIQLYPSDKLYQLSEDNFDVVTMWHVLEHVHKLHEYISQIKKIIKPGGRIFIAVPNYLSSDATVYRQFWAAYDVPRHLYHFSPKSMRVFLTGHGLHIEKVIPMWFDSFYVSLLSEKYKRGKVNYLRGFWNGFLSNLKTLSDKKKASSLIYVVTKT